MFPAQLKLFKKQVKSDDLFTVLPTLLNHTDGAISGAGIALFLALRPVYKAQAKALLEGTAEGQKAAILPQVIALIEEKTQQGEATAAAASGGVDGGGESCLEHFVCASSTWFVSTVVCALHICGHTELGTLDLADSYRCIDACNLYF